MKIKESLDVLRGAEASMKALFGDVGSSNVSKLAEGMPNYQTRVNEAMDLYLDAVSGDKRARFLFGEALTTSDFPILLGDILQRQMLASYREIPSTWQEYCKRSTVPDFRTVKRVAVDGLEGAIGVDPDETIKERAPYPEQALRESEYEYTVHKRGRRFSYSWEMAVNDDLDQFSKAPERLAKAARRGEERFATSLFAGNLDFFKTQNGNLLSGNPTLSVEALEAAYADFLTRTDDDDEPIAIGAVHLVVPPSLKLTAQRIVNLVERRITDGDNELIVRGNGLPDTPKVHTNFYLPSVDTTNGATGWYLFADPDDSRPGVEVGFLRGHEEPEIFVKKSDAQKVAGGDDDFDFDHDQKDYKVRTVWGGTTLDPKATLFSKGTGS